MLGQGENLDGFGLHGNAFRQGFAVDEVRERHGKVLLIRGSAGVQPFDVTRRGRRPRVLTCRIFRCIRRDAVSSLLCVFCALDFCSAFHELAGHLGHHLSPHLERRALACGDILARCLHAREVLLNLPRLRGLLC